MTKTGDNLTMLNIIFCTSIVISNVVGCKVLDFGLSVGNIPLLLSGGAITYAFTFLCTDVIGELWGKDEAGKAVKRGLATQLFALALIYVTMLLPTKDGAMQDAYVTLLGQTPFFVLGSLAAYTCAQSCDVWIFHKVRNYFAGASNRRWIWNNVSTSCSQIVDTVIYALVAFGLGLGWLFTTEGRAGIISIIAGQYLIKLCLAILDTPFFYILTNKR